MTEAQWTASTDPAALLRWLTYTTGGGMGDGPPLWFSSDRKQRLLEDACFERFGLNLDVAAQTVPPPGVCDLIRCVHGNPWGPVSLCGSCVGGRRFDAPCADCGLIRCHNDGAVVQIARTIDQERRPADLGILADALEEAGCPEEVACPACEGDGHARTAVGTLLHGPCPRCGRSGRVPNSLLAHLRQVDVACPACGGQGDFVTSWPNPSVDGCDACGGSGRVPAHALPGCWVIDLILGKE